jgi:hypothetical protein
VVRAALMIVACSIAVAGAQPIATPDGRVRFVPSTSFDPGSSSGSIGISGNVGAYGFDNAVEGGPGGGHVTNPPFYASLGTDGARYEEIYGPRIANATIGTGAITEGVDSLGRVTVLGWPGPGMYDQVSFVTVTRGYPNAGAPANAGSFAGIGSSWLTPAFGWTSISQAYASDQAETLVTVLENPSLGLRATITDVVDPSDDVVARNFRFACAAAAPCELPGSIAYYADMNPTTSRVARVPSVTDGAFDDFSDFGTVYDAADSVMLHFRPYKVDPTALSILATSHPDPETARGAIAGAFGSGVYVAVGGQSVEPEFQAGVNSGGLIGAEGENTPFLDPYTDLGDDGHLSGSLAAFGKTAGALAALAPDPDGSFTIYLAAADEPAETIELIRRARGRGFAGMRARSEADWAIWVSRARLPATHDHRTLAVARRALMLIRTAQDRSSGAIIANATTQTPYRQDWVRDGSFFNYALLLAGYPEMALRHAEFYRRVYRTGGTWDSFYYTDGAEAGAVFPYEVDSQALALWALWLPHELGGDASDPSYLSRMYPAIRDTADALLLCRDPTNGMQCSAPEDDALTPTQGAQGAATVYLALSVAARAADELGDVTRRSRWDERADELRQAALTKLCGTDRCQDGRGGVYLLWPSRLLDPTSALGQSHMGQFADELDAHSAFADPPLGGFFQYPMEPLLMLAPFWQDVDRAARLDGWMRWLTHDVPEPGVLHYAERIFRCDGQNPCAPGRRYLHTTGFPHIWSGAEAYIAAAFAYGITGCPPSVASIGEAGCR